MNFFQISKNKYVNLDLVRIVSFRYNQGNTLEDIVDLDFLGDMNIPFKIDKNIDKDLRKCFHHYEGK